jgi:hypothetical protein
MIDEDAVAAFNSRVTVDLNNYKKFTPAQRDRAKAYGSDAEADSLITITGHTADDNSRRVAMANQLSGMDAFIASLKRAVIMKNRIVEWEADPRQNQ